MVERGRGRSEGDGGGPERLVVGARWVRRRERNRSGKVRVHLARRQDDIAWRCLDGPDGRGTLVSRVGDTVKMERLPLYSLPTRRYTARRGWPHGSSNESRRRGLASHDVGPSAMTADAAKEGSGVSFTDLSLTCRDCESVFVFSAGEQAFFAEKGLTNQPQRCPQCRANRRRERNGQPPRELHAVPCHECGVVASVPFLPRLDRPVYCSSCFDRVRSAASV